MRNRKSGKIIVMLMSMAIVIGLTSCGETANTTSENFKIKFVLDWVPNTNHTGIFAADKLGFYTAEGLDVEIVQPPEGGALSLVAAGQADFGIDYQDYMAPAFANDNPLPVTAVATIMQHNTSGIISLSKTGINSPKDLEGKKYATLNNPTEQAILKNLVESDGGDYSKVEQVPSVITDVISALNTNIDCAWIYYGWDGVACELNGLDTNFMKISDFNPTFDYYTPVIVANNNFLASHPEETKKFLRATKKGYEYAIQNPEESAKILLEADQSLDPEITKASQEWVSKQYKADEEQWGYIDPTRWNNFYSWLYEEKLIDRDITGMGFTNEYLTE